MRVYAWRLCQYLISVVFCILSLKETVIFRADMAFKQVLKLRNL